MTITADTTEIFPNVPSYGFTVEPQYLVSIVQREAGYERRVRRWARPLNRYTAVPLAERVTADIYSVWQFWHAMGGRATVFRLLDPFENLSCAPGGVVARTDQPVVSLGNGTYQLVKRYTYGSVTQDRYITRPKGSTILIGGAGGSTITAFDLNESTGVITPTGSPLPVPTTWGGQFYVPVRFDSELPVEMSNKGAQRVTFALAEVRE